MALLFLDAGSFDQVRKALDLSLDAESLPDDTIQLPIYAPDAEDELLARNPAAATYAEGSAQKERAIRAAIYLTAARLVPSLPAIASESLGDWKLTQTPPDLVKLAASLRGRASSLITQNVTGSSLAPLQSFWLASGRRGL